jgi:hypothetical protein
MKKLIGVCLAVVMLLPAALRADEGMWLPMLVKRLNYQDMRAHGLQLSADEIYSVNKSSLKDAIVVLNGGSCTAEMISGQGLFLTNHHCAYGAIQDNSSTDHDYLTDGFWAYAKGEELQANGMTAGFLQEMRDVTDAVLGDVSISLTGEERTKAVRAAIAAAKEKIQGEVAEHFDVQIKSFFEGNEYYAFVYETFRDVRLVGAPPSSIGKYGGDTDNWMWPRHTGDFSMMRVYMGPDGKPAEYSKDNVPYAPKHFLPVSIDGVAKGDYAMIMGYPGSTDRYLSSYGVEQQLNVQQPNTVKIRAKKLELLKEDMNADPAVRIAYASKYAQISNYWKYFIGQQRGLKRLKVKEQKQALESEFQNWVNADAERKKIYGSVLADWESAFSATNETALFRTYFRECVFGVESNIMAYRASGLGRALDAEEVNQEQVKEQAEAVRERAKKFFKDYNMSTDKKLAVALYEFFSQDIPQDLQPKEFKDLVAKNKNDYAKMVDKMFSKSIFTSEERLNAFLNEPSKKVLDKDPVYQMTMSFLTFLRGPVSDMTTANDEKIETSNRLFVNGLRKMNTDKNYYPNANSTMRVTYGNVLDYYPADAMHYDFFTTIEGVMEKEDPNNDEFIVPAKLKELYNAKDYGRYGEDGTLRVCFLTNTDITGGNSGSPVINGKGELIGCAFDGNWEAMSGDIAFEPKLQRTIAVDIRYVLFIVDKFAGAKNLIDEMKIVSSAGLPKPETMPAQAPVDAQDTRKLMKSSK